MSTPISRRFHAWAITALVVSVVGCESYEYCPEGQSWCWARCVFLESDDENCGSCGNACDVFEVCVNGSCRSSCTCLSDTDCSEDQCCFEDCVCAHKDCTGLECGPDPVCNMSCGDCGSSGSCVNGECVGGCTTREDCAGPVCLVCKDHECVPPPPVCQGDQDCCLGYRCNLGICVSNGPECVSDDECRAIDPEKPRCVDGRCELECIADIDCPLPEMACIDNHCIRAEPGQPGDPCAYDTVNATAGDCDEGLVCLGQTADSFFGTCPNGHTWECEDIFDSYNPDCVDGNCGYSFCAEECNETWECPSGFAPQDCNGTCYCTPSTTGVWAVGDPCHLGDVHQDYFCCPPGLRCLGRPADGNSGTCPDGDPAECTEYPPSHNPDCVNANCGYSFCVPRCDVVGNCPRGYEPLDVNGMCYCIPSKADSQAGEPCPFGNVNDFASFCIDGLTCLGNEDTGSCPNGSVSECIGLPESWHPDCANGICGFSFCSEECDLQGNCPLGFVPAEVSGACYCLPADPGDSQAGDPCPISDTNLPHDNCAFGLTCVGGHSGTCPGGSPAECTEFPASWNPDCVNGVCGYSFCAYRCDSQGNCPAGFWPQNLGSTCYCMPD